MGARTVTIMVTGLFPAARSGRGAGAPNDLAGLLGLHSGVVADGGGRVVRTIEDGAIAVFDSAADALRSAVALQQRCWRGGGDEAVAARVGIHTADVADFSGTGEPLGPLVTVARGLCDHGAAGEVHASRTSVSVAGGVVTIDVHDAGEVAISGVPEPVDALRVVWAPASAAPVTVIVAEDVALVRAGLVALLREEGFDVVAEASDSDSLLDAARRLRPALVITDVRMPPTQTDEGIVAAATLRAEQADIAVLVLSQHVEPSAAALLLTNNPTSVGYVLKERVSHIDEFVAACRTVAAGGVVIDPLVTERLMQGRGETVASLSEREREVLELMAQGRSNAAIARTVHCSAKTLESHIRSIFLKLDLLEDPDENRRVGAVVRYLARRR